MNYNACPQRFLVVAIAKAKMKMRQPAAAPQRDDHRAFAGAIGRLLRLSRAKRGMTRRQLAHASGASERYLAQIESGQGNPSVIILESIARALDIPIIELLPRSNVLRMRSAARLSSSTGSSSRTTGRAFPI